MDDPKITEAMNTGYGPENLPRLVTGEGSVTVTYRGEIDETARCTSHDKAEAMILEGIKGSLKKASDLFRCAGKLAIAELFETGEIGDVTFTEDGK